MKRWLRRMFAFTHRLLWRLTFSYALVTVIVLGVLLIAVIFFTNLATFTTTNTVLMMAQALNTSAERLAEPLERSPVDRQALDDWVQAVARGRWLVIDNGRRGISYNSLVSTEMLLAVVDPQGRVLAANRPERLPPGSALTEANADGAAGLLEQTAAGETRPARLLYLNNDRLAIAAPVLGSDQRLLGIVYLHLQRPGVLEMLYISIYTTMPLISILGALAVLIGLAFGALNARGLARRLERVTEATTAWGRGDFSVRITDTRRDEVGMLARDLNKMADRLEDLMQARQELAALEERNYLARELHDSAKQQVFAISMNLAAVKALWERSPEEARKRLEIAAELSRQSQHELTTLVQTLRPAQLEEETLSQALTRTVRFWEKQNGLEALCAIQESPQRLPAETEQALFRVAQEALSNIARHSKATQAEIALTFQDGQVELVIQDNGCGFDLQQPVRGLGLRSMQERVQALGGNFHLTSQPGRTCLTVRAPIHKRSNHG